VAEAKEKIKRGKALKQEQLAQPEAIMAAQKGYFDREERTAIR